LRGFKPETWRYRIGPQRFFYEVDEQKKIVFLIAAETRQGSYSLVSGLLREGWHLGERLPYS